MSFRRSILISLISIGALTLSAAISLAVVTDYLSETVALLGSSLKNIQAAQQIEVDLMIHSAARTELTRAALERDLRNGLLRVERYITSPAEARLVAAAEESVKLYLEEAREQRADSSNIPSSLDQALTAVHHVTDLNVAQARTAEAEAVRWHRLADRAGLGIALVVLVGIPLIVTWVAMFAFRPMFGIFGAMQAFASGNIDARVNTHIGMGELRRLGQAFNEMADAIRRQRENQTAFLAGVSHDLKNPLNALNLSVAVLSDRAALPPEKKLRGILRIVKSQIEFLNRMIDDLHDINRSDAGQVELHKEVCDVGTLINDVAELYSTVSSAHRLEVVVPESPVLVTCDPDRLHQVLNNLVSNAIKYSPRGGRIILSLDESGNEIVVEVSDSGIGIPQDELPHIFEPFRRTRLSKMKMPGTGLGLHVSRRIVEAHGGHIDVDSETGKGTHFRVHLPKAA